MSEPSLPFSNIFGIKPMDPKNVVCIDTTAESGLMKTEAEMRDEKAPTPEIVEQLAAYVKGLVDRDHDYGTCVYAMSLAATAAFNFVASKLGVTEFQASCADLDILRRLRHLDGPFMLIKGEDMLYPQYDLPEKLREAMSEWRDWVAGEARKRLAGNTSFVHPAVVAHWERLAAQETKT